MVGHGSRSEKKRSRRGGFECLVCGHTIAAGDWVVGFRDMNRPANTGWDHVHAKTCADKYKPPALKPKQGRSTKARVKDAVSGAWQLLSGLSVPSHGDSLSVFMRKARQLEFSDAKAREVLDEFDGDEEAALYSMASAFAADAAGDLDSGSATCGAATESATGDARENEMDASSDEELPPQPKEVLQFDSKAARAAVYDVFHSFVAPLLSKPQTDGGFKDGDPSLLDALMPSPCTLALPRAERLADLIKPEDGWDEQSMQRSLGFFNLAGAGVQFLIFLPTITHRSELARSPLFQVKKDGEVVGIRDCCPCCRSNRFVNVTDGSYNIRFKQDFMRNGVRFIYSMSGAMVPISRSAICRSPVCPANVAKLNERSLQPPSLEKHLPRAKAPDGKPWPSSSFSTHSDEYVQLVAEAVPTLGVLFRQYLMFGEGGCDAALASKLMQTTSTVAQLARELEIQAKERERAALNRYVAYMREQQLQCDMSLPLLPSPLELSRCSLTQSQQLTQQAVQGASAGVQGAPAGAVRFGSLVAAENIENDFMRRFFSIMPRNAKHVDSDDDGATVTTAATAALAPHRATRARTAAKQGGTDVGHAERDESAAGSGDSVMQDAAAHDDGVALKAPPWRFVTGSASVLNVSETNIRTIMRHIHKAVKPYLTANLLNREPGEFMSHDHTFRIANRALGDARAYSFFLGEDHAIVWHGAVKGTSYDELVPAMEGMQRRFVRLGKSGKLKYVYDDLCCRGLPSERLHEHPVVDVFPGVTRCPRKDGFHACHLVTQTFNAGTGEVDVHARDVGSTLRPIFEPDLQIAITHLVQSEKLSRSEARREAMKRYRGTGILRTFGPQPKDLRVRWQNLIDRLRQDRDVKGSKSIVRTQYAMQKGTLEQMESMFSCIDKGCYSDPLPSVKRMYIAHARHSCCSQLLYRVKKSESVKNETIHKGANRLVQDISRMGEDLLDIRIDFFVLANNLKVDARHGRSDAVSLGMPHEMVFLNQIAESVLQDALFATAAANAANMPAGGVHESSDIFEPHGFGYHKHVEALDAEAKAAAARADAERASSEAASHAGGLPLAKPPKATGKRASKARKGVTQKLLNMTPLKPSLPHEVELMLNCVQNAHKSKKRRKISAWQVAADEYQKRFIENCAKPEEERVLIRATTTAAMIEESYTAMATNHRAYVADQLKSGAGNSSTADSMLPALTMLPETAGDDGLTMGGAEGDAQGDAAPARSKPLKGRAKWQHHVAQGRALRRDEVAGLGATALVVYLRAMGERLTRAEVASVELLRDRAISALAARGVDTWSGVQSE